ncbi:MAG: thiamine pyrophosphate-dependent dehydrogenase E1 component subunit alpha [Candidatus Omnitrophota bacterium]
MRKNINLELYKKLFLVRRSEEKITELYHENDMKTPMHMSMGAEAIAVGICHALTNEDQVFGTYRSHALYLSKTQDVHNFFAEMYAKESSSLKGRGGSMHLFSPEHGFMGTSAIVASSIPVAAGAAFANKIEKNDKITAVFFGDGATEEGVFWESINAACLMKLPVLFVCEDNQCAVHTPVSMRQGYEDISKIISKFNCNVLTENTTDVENVYNLTKKALKMMKDTQLPCFMRLKYYRYLEHVGVNFDFDAGYRSEEEFIDWKLRDPLKVQREKLSDFGVEETAIKHMENVISERIDNIVDKVKQDSFVDVCEIYKEVLENEKN